MRIEVLGPGCPKCQTLAANAEAVARKLGLDYEMVKVTEIAQIAAYGVMMTPGLAINGDVKFSGKVPSEAELTSILTTAAANEDTN